jgi:hypothetical protein
VLNEVNSVTDPVKKALQRIDETLRGMHVSVVPVRRRCAIVPATCEGKVIPVTGRGGPYGCETSRLPHSLDSRLTDGREVVSLTRRPHLYPQEDSSYPFLLEAESDPVPYCVWKD